MKFASDWVAFTSFFRVYQWIRDYSCLNFRQFFLCGSVGGKDHGTNVWPYKKSMVSQKSMICPLCDIKYRRYVKIKSITCSTKPHEKLFRFRHDNSRAVNF